MLVDLTPHPVTVQRTCPTCGGSGNIPENTEGYAVHNLPAPGPCPRCEGQGWLRTTYQPRLWSKEDADTGRCPSDQIGKPNPARVSTTPVDVGHIGGTLLDMGVPVVENEWGEIEGLPDLDPWCGPDIDHPVYIVSLVVIQAIERRGWGARLREGKPAHDIVAPDTGPGSGAIRDDQGRIVAVTRFVRPRG